MGSPRPKPFGGANNDRVWGRLGQIWMEFRVESAVEVNGIGVEMGGG